MMNDALNVIEHIEVSTPHYLYSFEDIEAIEEEAKEIEFKVVSLDTLRTTD